MAYEPEQDHWLAQAGTRADLSVSTLIASCGVCVPITVSEQRTNGTKTNAYIWQATICAPANLWFVDIDEDLRVTERTTATITSYKSFIDPSHRLFVNEVYGCIRSWLKT